MTLYDNIGQNYASLRRPDPRIDHTVRKIHAMVNDSRRDGPVLREGYSGISLNPGSPRCPIHHKNHWLSGRQPIRWCRLISHLIAALSDINGIYDVGISHDDSGLD